ncbi:MAG: hypothetical protein EPO35_00080 [Acidobacteria bacterium]|nr:MAG: hypothetical protein EPO35_00080 [Acidobacteriota bacterium]
MLPALALLTILAPSTALAQVTAAAGYTPPDDTQAIKVGAVVFYDYTYTKTPKTTDSAGNTFSPSVFNVARTYLNVTGNISHRVAFRITPDITRESGTGSSLAGSLTVRLKYGYAQFNLDDWTGNWKQTYIRAGIQQTPFIDAQEGVYRYRFQGTVFVERDGGLSSADAGVTFHTNLPNNYGDFHIGLYNGEGYSKAEINNQKSLQVRGTFRPMPGGGFAVKGLRLTGYYNKDHVAKNADRNRAIGSVFYEYKRFNAGFDYIARSDEASATAAKVNSDGWSVFVTPFFKEKGNGLEGLFRYDSFRANKSLDARQNRTIAGLAYWFPHPGGAATAAILLDFEQVDFKNFTGAGTAPAKQQRIALHGLINF